MSDRRPSKFSNKQSGSSFRKNCCCDLKPWVVLLTIFTWIFAASISVLPVAMALITQAENNKKTIFYKVLGGFQIVQFVVAFSVLCGMLMKKEYVKLRIAVAAGLQIETIFFTAVIFAVAEHTLFLLLFIAIPVLFGMWYAIYSYYKNLLGDDF